MLKEIKQIYIKPDDIDKNASHFSNEIINTIMNSKAVDVVSFGTSIFLACAAVNISTDIANVHLHDIGFDYVDIPIFGKNEIMFLTLRNTPKEPSLNSLSKELDKTLKLTFEPKGQLIVVSREQSVEKMIPLCLWKLSKSNVIKIVAGGSIVNNAVKIALKLLKGGISKDPLRVKLISLERLERTKVQPGKLITGIAIYLEKGKESTLSEHHMVLLNKIKTEIRSSPV